MWRDSMDVDERRELIELFLRRCVTYADASIERKKQRGEDEGIICLLYTSPSPRDRG